MNRRGGVGVGTIAKIPGPTDDLTSLTWGRHIVEEDLTTIHRMEKICLTARLSMQIES